MAEYVQTINLAIVCTTLLLALLMLRDTVRTVAGRQHFAFVVRLPFKIIWVFAGGDESEKLRDNISELLVSTEPDGSVVR